MLSCCSLWRLDAITNEAVQRLKHELRTKAAKTVNNVLAVLSPAALDAAIHGEMDRISQALTHRVKELAERYETPMPQMVTRVAELEGRVNRHLERMGFSCR